MGSWAPSGHRWSGAKRLGGNDVRRLRLIRPGARLAWGGGLFANEPSRGAISPEIQHQGGNRMPDSIRSLRHTMVPIALERYGSS